MKLLRIGSNGNEKPAALDKNGKIRDLSSHIKDFNPMHLNFEIFSKLENIELTPLAVRINERTKTDESNPALCLSLISSNICVKKP